MADELTIDSEQFVSSKRASEISGYEQDYIGQLSRGGQLKARRVGGLWYVSLDSLQSYKERSEAYKPEPPVQKDLRSDPDALLSFDGRGYISAARASKLTGYSSDYVGQLARAGTVLARQVGNRWYVERTAIMNHKESKDSLLGAVQSASVGIRRTEISNTGRQEGLIAVAEPFFEYTSDSGELMPVLSSGPSMREPDREIVEYQIPIHIRDDNESGKTQPVYRHKSMMVLPSIKTIRAPEKTRYSLALSAIALTIVVVLSLGFVSLKSSAVYTVNEANEISANRENRQVLTASVATVLLGRFVDFLESLLTTEVVYIRKG